MMLIMTRKGNYVLLCTLGGAISNMYAMLIARFKMFPEVKEKGMAAVPRLIAFTSEHSHFSLKKGAAALGIGTDSVILIKCDER
ncbi:hypothetical protein QTO34_008004 [Cnephaeus nilssonii]|uniref:Glutamate decarboxylase 2 n=1 Tax=Cnephaeus nilssonii TaxID=3371016 RepID=A0AA40IAD9_CNENI|nr:hypothetical protein QTO34_008004 [Eptesicus nilssonii]